ncbi:MAG: aldo/keto reductase [Rhodospirillaceae bacterium]|nr:aldo/keto reductase [Rhodospirillaceae bacterium]
MDQTSFSRATFLKLAAAAATAPILPAFAADAGLALRAIPKSKAGEQLPVIGLGTAQEFGVRSDAANRDAKQGVIKTLSDKGAKVLDTAASYSDAEAVCGEFMEKLGNRSKLFIATKFGETGKDAGMRSVENSFKRLRTNVIDLMYVHNMIDTDTHLPWLKDLKAQNRIRYFGVTSTGGNQDRLATWMDQVDFVEFAYSVDYRAPEQKLLPMARDKGVAVFVALPFGRNRLLNKMRGKEVPAWAREELGCKTYAQLALKFLVSHPAVTVAIPGTENPAHMAENIEAGRGPLADEKQRARIAQLWENA